MSFHKSRWANISFFSLSRTPCGDTYVEYSHMQEIKIKMRRIFFFLFMVLWQMHRYTYSQNVNDSTILKYLQNAFYLF